MRATTGQPVDRATPDDVISLATDVGPVPMQVAAVLVLDTADGFDPDEAIATMGRRIHSVARLRQRLIHAPFGCGRPYWVDDRDFAVDHHVRVVARPGSGGEEDLLALAAELVATPLPADRPLWSATFVPGLALDRTGLIVVFHHVLADGIGGLAVLANLVDGAAEVEPPASFPRPWPSTSQLARDAWRERLRALGHLGTTSRLLRDAITELRATRPDPPPRTSLNRPTGARRTLAVVRAELEPIHAVARANGATVNDAVLTAVAGALGRLLETRGEVADRVVMSVPVSARREATANDLGNRVGAVPVGVPAVGDGLDRLATIAASTRAAKAAPRGASSAVLGPAFRILGRLGMFQWFIERQHLVTTFTTNLRGPDARLAFLGAPILDVLPVAVVTGNVTVSFAVLSYAGTLAITIIADPDACPDLGTLRDALGGELTALTDRLDSTGS